MRERRKIFSWVSVFIIIILLIPIIRSSLFSGEEFRPVSLSPQKQIQKKFEEKDVTKAYQDENFQLYYIKQGDFTIAYAYSRHMGLWVQDASEKSQRLISYGGNNVYYYGEGSLVEEIQLCVGGKSIKTQQLNIGNETHTVYIIEGYKTIYKPKE